MVGIMLIGAIIVGLLLICNWIANRITDGQYGNGEHLICIRYWRSEPLVDTSVDVGEIHEWRDGALSDRSVRSIEITYANGQKECTTR
ncbi:MAG: hypothetical protein ACYDER_07970 [Ktedonobacteraceae bacterium]